MKVMWDAPESMGPWARKAEALYDDGYARKYRDRDEALLQEAELSGPYGLAPKGVCALRAADRRSRPGVRHRPLFLGRDKHAHARRVRRVGGHAGRSASSDLPGPHQRAATSRWSRAIWRPTRFRTQFFDLVYSIGVLAEHVPLDAMLVSRVWSWLKPGGRFAFTTVHPQSPDVPQTARGGVWRWRFRSRLAVWAARCIAG